ncbi:ribonuclease P protein subunit p14-like [Macrobrachium nipponense]|uniref:ribonuclease P protein subunit p14-like n=1 Tax=Macrobrachium nipponense TaxID=159736 RepID=UPI0030C80176
MKMKELDCSHWYLDIEMDYGSDLDLLMAVDILKFFMLSAVKTMFGEVAASSTLDILKFDEEERRAIVRVPSENYAKFRAALTMCSAVRLDKDVFPFIFTIKQASSCLLSLTGPQRIIT